MVVLGAALLGDAAVDAATSVRSWVTPEHAMIADALRALREQHIPISAPVLCAQLDDRQQLHVVGGAAYLDSLLDAASAAAARDGTLRLDRYVATLSSAALDREEQHAAAGLSACLANADRAGAAHYRAELRRVASARRDGALGRWTEALRTVGVPTGDGITLAMPQLGTYWGWLWPGQSAIVAGRTSVGKTALCAALALSWALGGVRVHVLSLEDTEREWAERFVATLARTPISTIRRGVSDPTAIDSAATYLASLPLTVEHRGGSDADGVASAVGAAVAGGAKVVIVDYVQAIAWGDDGSEYAMLQHALGAIEHALGHSACCVLGSQLARGEERGAVTSMHMLRGSGALEERARKVLLLHRMKDSDTTTTCGGATITLAAAVVEVAKNKGPVGTLQGYVWTDYGVWWPGGAAPAWSPERKVDSE